MGKHVLSPLVADLLNSGTTLVDNEVSGEAGANEKRTQSLDVVLLICEGFERPGSG